jgi:organic hydroperoxide reductase OsmC/OhrA
VTLHPAVRWSGAALPSPTDQDAMHHEAHASCFIANSVRTDVRCEPVAT